MMESVVVLVRHAALSVWHRQGRSLPHYCNNTIHLDDPVIMLLRLRVCSKVSSGAADGTERTTARNGLHGGRK